MPVPWQAVLPAAIMTFFFGVTGSLLTVTSRAENLGKPARYNIDGWDEMMMKRDAELTGHARRQSDDPVAPAGYKATNFYPKSK